MLVFSEYAAQKIYFLRENCNTEVISGDKNKKFLEGSAIGVWEGQPNFIVDWDILQQESSPGTTDLNPDKLSEYMDNIGFQYLDKHPEDNDGYSEIIRYSGKVWAHTHPSDVAIPSQVDDNTFNEVYIEPGAVFGSMFILADQFNYTNKMIYETKFMGRKVSNEKVKVRVEKTDVCVDLSNYLKALIDVESFYKIASDLGFTLNPDECLYLDCSKHHDMWLKEIQDNIEEHIVLQTHNNLITSPHNHHPHLQQHAKKNVAGFSAVPKQKDIHIHTKLLQEKKLWVHN